VRWIIYLLIIAMAGGLGFTVWSNEADKREQVHRQDMTRDAIQQFRDELREQRTRRFVEMGEDRFPESIDPAWFGADHPMNHLVDGTRHPWVEVAGRRMDHREHPRDLTASGDAAQFWYNPSNGVVRARVMPMISDDEALRVYNAVNGTNLRTLFPDS
jgi:hypothetical protein